MTAAQAPLTDVDAGWVDLHVGGRPQLSLIHI